MGASSAVISMITRTVQLKGFLLFSVADFGL
jgi:hypothetical protein